MNFFVAVTDYDWFQLHASKSSVVEVNFWRPSPEASFKALNAGEMLLFKLHFAAQFYSRWRVLHPLCPFADLALMGSFR